MTDDLDTAEDPEAPSFWARLHARLHRNRAMSATTKVVVTLLGLLVLGAGLVMMVTPGPGLVGIVAGLAILSTEWEWAERWLTSARRRLDAARRAAAAMDPVVRRRRMLLASAATVVVVGLTGLYVAVRDWPRWTVSAWDRAQSFLGFLPELPGM